MSEDPKAMSNELDEAEIKKAAEFFELSEDDARMIVYSCWQVVTPFRLLSQYDSGSIVLPRRAVSEDARNRVFSNEQEWRDSGDPPYEITADTAIKLADYVTRKFHENHGFGIEREPGALASIIRNLYQTGGGEDLYPTPMDKAANLLYLVIKNHPFENGNKRIAVFLFCVYLNMLDPSVIEDGQIKYNAMPAIALLIANSDPGDKDLMVSFVKGLFA